MPNHDNHDHDDGRHNLKNHPAYPLMEYLVSLPEPILDRDLDLLLGPASIGIEPKIPIFHILMREDGVQQTLVGNEQGRIEWHTDDLMESAIAEYRPALIAYSEYVRIPIMEPLSNQVLADDSPPIPTRIRDYTIHLKEHMTRYCKRVWICRDQSTGDWWIKR